MKRIGVYTSGGDAPGMNACIRAIVRTAITRGLEVTGIEGGYAGMIAAKFLPMNMRSVSNIICRGGTILKSSRCPEFKTQEGRAKAAANLRAAGVDGIIGIGGNGTSEGAHNLWLQERVPLVVCASTIDNDLYGTDYTLGFDTAMNTALEAIDRLRDTAAAHDRTSFIEVMGRNNGYLALYAGLAGGAEEIVIPEVPTDVDALCQRLLDAQKRGKTSSIVVVAEGPVTGGVVALAEKVGASTHLDMRVTVLGHVQRGGAPTARDRINGSRLGAAAVETLLAGEADKLVGLVSGQTRLTPLEEAYTKKKPINQKLMDLAYILAR
ncbi:MAG: 6-phosphofructokinase [Verrucomicrobia bacterium]|nr:6-phosphofructokinase [Verrucomicrobiota bacterium]